MAWLEKLSQFPSLDLGSVGAQLGYQPSIQTSPSPAEGKGQPWAFSDWLDLSQIGLRVQASPKAESQIPQATQAPGSGEASQLSGLFDFRAIGAHLGVQNSSPPDKQITATPGTQPHQTESSPLEGEISGTPAFSGLFAGTGTEEINVETVQQSDGIDAAGELLEGEEMEAIDDLAQEIQEHKRTIRPENLDSEDAMDGHAVTPWEAASDAEAAPMESHNLHLTRDAFISHWAPFSSYFHPGHQVAIAPSQEPEAAAEVKVQTPEGFLVVSVQHHESVADPTDISVGRYFYFDASSFPSFPAFEVSPYSFVEQWREGQLFWSGQVQFSTGSYGSVDLPAMASPAAGRKGREESKPGDFEVGDLIFVAGFHRDLANTNGKRVDFDDNLHFYQAAWVGSKLPFNQSLLYDDLADLGQRIALGIEVDEHELAAVRPVLVAPEVAKANVNTIVQSGAHITDLAADNFAVRDIPDEGGAKKVNSSADWGARRKDFLSAGLKSLERRAQENGENRYTDTPNES